MLVDLSGRIRNLNDYFVSRLKPNSEEREFQLSGHKFSLKSLKFYGFENSEHQLCYCANHREVKSENLDKHIVDLTKNRKIRYEDNKPFTYLAYISGSYLDEHVNSERINFNIPEEQPYSSVVIVEFKRPMRGRYKDNENPITQVYDYIRKIKSGSFVDREGRLVNLPEHIPFYAYIICDLTPKIKGFAEDATYYPTPDLKGYFGYNPRLNTYVEILSFTKLINDAKRRNNVLFKKLNL